MVRPLADHPFGKSAYGLPDCERRYEYVALIRQLSSVFRPGMDAGRFDSDLNPGEPAVARSWRNELIAPRAGDSRDQAGPEAPDRSTANAGDITPGEKNQLTGTTKAPCNLIANAAPAKHTAGEVLYETRQPFDLSDELRERVERLDLAETVGHAREHGYGYVRDAAPPEFTRRLCETIVRVPEGKDAGGGVLPLQRQEDPKDLQLG